MTSRTSNSSPDRKPDEMVCVSGADAYQQEMTAFDALPPDLRAAVRRTSEQISALQVQTLLETYSRKSIDELLRKIREPDYVQPIRFVAKKTPTRICANDYNRKR